MTAQKLAAYRIPEELLQALQEIKERDGIPVSEQVRRALAAWVEARGIAPSAKTERKRAVTRKRS